MDNTCFQSKQQLWSRETIDIKLFFSSFHTCNFVKALQSPLELNCIIFQFLWSAPFFVSSLTLVSIPSGLYSLFHSSCLLYLLYLFMALGRSSILLGLLLLLLVSVCLYVCLSVYLTIRLPCFPSDRLRGVQVRLLCPMDTCALSDGYVCFVRWFQVPRGPRGVRLHRSDVLCSDE